MTNPKQVLANKRLVKGLLDAVAGGPVGRLRKSLEAAYHPDVRWRGSHPLNEMAGLDEIESKVWRPLLQAFPDLERRDNLLIGGTEPDGSGKDGRKGRDYVGAVGCYAGRFMEDWLGIPATGGAVYLRYGEMHQVQDGKIIQSTVLLDILDLIRQTGRWPLSTLVDGIESRSTWKSSTKLTSIEMWPPPITGDGMEMAVREPRQSAESLDFTLAMHRALDNDITDREGLLSMAQKDYWHPKMMWYGPGGVGTGRGLQGFIDVHQLPFRRSFPKRKYGGAGHYAHIGDGHFTVTAGWPSVLAKHEGSEWLGIPATGREIEMRVMDFYLIDEGKIRENWVPIDILHILLQMGVDVLASISDKT